MKSLFEFLKDVPDLGSTFFYPGSYEDFGMIETFVEKSSIDCFIFVDYIDQRFDLDRVSNCLPNYRIKSCREIFPSYFHAEKWDEFWFDHPQSRDFGQPENAYAYLYELISPVSGKKFKLYYLGTDAIKTYEVLFNFGLIPDVILLQDHGFGGQWRQFKVYPDSEYGPAEESYLYTLVMKLGKPPKYLFAQHWDGEFETISPWPEYIQVTDPIALGGDMHGFKRCLFKKK
jgi:hypothetical protein